MRSPPSLALALIFSLGACSDDAKSDAGEDANIGMPGDLARGELEITAIEVSQSLVQPVYLDGEVVSPADYAVPLVPGRTTLVRAYWDPPLEWTPRPLTARLHIEGPDGEELVYDDIESAKGTPPFVQGKTKALDLLTGFYWRLAPAEVTPGMRYSVTVVEVEETEGIPETEGKTRWPREDNTALPIQSAPSALNLYLVGVRYDVPGCSTDTSTLPAAELEAIRAGFEVWSAIGTDSVTIDTSLSIDVNTPSGAVQMLERVGPIRAEYSHIPDAFFLILLDDCSVVPDGLLGVAPVNSDPPVLGEAASRYGSGLWNPNDVRESVNTAVHEIGHSQGALHAPCGMVDGADPAYPHANATLGAVGLDATSEDFYLPDLFTDFMSYCRPYWTSDYRFSKNYIIQSTLTSWAADTHGGALAAPDAPSPALPNYTGVMLTGVVQASGESHWWVNRDASPPPATRAGELRVELRTATATHELPARTLALPDLPGGRLVQVPLIDGITREDIEAIAVHGALELRAEAPTIVDARAPVYTVRTP